MTHAADARSIATDPPLDVLSMADLLSARLKDLLGRAIEEPETLDAAEVRELAASVLFCLASLREGAASPPEATAHARRLLRSLMMNLTANSRAGRRLLRTPRLPWFQAGLEN